MHTAFSLIIPLLLVSVIPFAYADHDSHDYVKKITIESDDVDSDLTDFPLLINFTDSDLQSNAFSDGLRITFTNADNSTELSHEIEQYDSSNGWLTAWVKIPTVSSSSDTDIFMYYGNNTNIDDQQSITDVWNNNYVLVTHLHDDYLDSTSNNNDGTNGGSSDIAGHIADAQSFDGINDHIQYVNGSNTSLDAPDAFTISAWVVNTDIVSGYNRLWSSGNPTQANAYSPIWLYALQQFQIQNTGHGFNAPTGLADDGNWWYVVWTFDNPTNDVDYFVNGVDVGGTPTSALTPASNLEWAELGTTSANSAQWFEGFIDEARISNVVLSDAWIDLEYCNQVATSICEPLTISSEEDLTTPPVTPPWSITGLTSTGITQTTVILDWTQPELNGESLIGYQINYTTPQSITVKTTGTIFLNDTGTIDDTITGLTHTTNYSATVSAWTIGGNNVTFANVYNFTTSTPPPPIPGKFIWFNCNPASPSILGCVYSLDCGSGNYVQGILSNGTLICTALP